MASLTLSPAKLEWVMPDSETLAVMEKVCLAVINSSQRIFLASLYSVSLSGQAKVIKGIKIRDSSRDW